MNWPAGLYRIRKSTAGCPSSFDSPRLIRSRLACRPRVDDTSRLVCAAFAVIGFPTPKIGAKKPYLTNLRKVWAGTLKRAGVPYFALYELRHTFATRLSAGGVADHMVTQMLRQGDADVFKLYSQAKLGMMREALAKLDRKANERRISSTEKAS